MIVYVVEPASVIKKNKNKVQITLNDLIIQEIPLNLIETIVVTGKVIVTNGVMEALLVENISFVWIGYNGRFIGKLENEKNYNIIRQYNQFKLYENDEKRLSISRQFILGKAKNQKTVLMRYNKNLNSKVLEGIIYDIKYYINKVIRSNSIEELMGLEGYIARVYFKGIGIIVPDEFSFTKRTKHPPLDPVNSVLSFGYSILFNDICNIVVGKKLNPYVPVLHSMRNGHQALCSDLIEEWRPIIIDSMVINMFKNNEFFLEDFVVNRDGVFIEPDAVRKFIKKYENKMSSYHKFLNDDGMDYRSSIQYQVSSFVSVLEDDTSQIKYEPILIR